MRLQDLRALLADTPLFEKLDGVAFGQIVREATLQRLAAKTVLFREGDPSSNLHVVLEGRVKVARLQQEREVVLGFRGPGDLVGGSAVFRRLPYRGTATLAADSILLTWSAELIFHLLERLPKLATNALAIVSRPPDELATPPDAAESGGKPGKSVDPVTR